MSFAFPMHGVCCAKMGSLKAVDFVNSSVLVHFVDIGHTKRSIQVAATHTEAVGY
jgi:hypothetical protein